MGDDQTAPLGGARTAVRVGLLGCGNVGGALVELLASRAEHIASRVGAPLELARVAVRDASRPRSVTLDGALVTTDAAAVAADPSLAVLVECMGGIEPARTLLLAALASGKHVVTANKELIASHGPELCAAAQAAGRELRFEAAVAGAIPLVRALQISLAGERVLRIMGIVNGTTNYVLTEMSESRISYTEALADAQALGYAEADPTADVAGYDAAAKAAILARIAFNAEIVASDVFREGIESVGVADIEFADRLGYVVKLLAVIERVPRPPGEPEAIAARVHPAMVPKDHPLATVSGPFNAVFLEGEAAGEMMLYGRGAGGAPTASAVLGDLIDVASHGAPRRRPTSQTPVVLAPIGELEAQYYVSVDVLDRPGVLAAVATVFGGHGVSIRSMEQVGLGDEARLVFITHRARESDVQATLADLGRLASVERTGGLLRVIGPER